ncbi:MAG: copper chaperone PCu(A)C [Alphaproteobacteria bacterium]
MIPPLAILISLVLAPTVLAAEEVVVGDIHIDSAWSRATASSAPAGAAYMVLTNHGGEVDRLVAVSSPAAERAQLHTHLMEGGVMKMRPVEAIEVAPGTPSVLEPGGLHVMLIGLRAPLHEGDRFPLTLTFEQAGEVEIEVVVQSAGSTDFSGHHQGHVPTN